MVIKLTPKGIELVTGEAVREWVENPEEMERAIKALNIDIGPDVRKCLRDYFDIQEDLMLIRSGEEPKHYFREFYGLK